MGRIIVTIAWTVSLLVLAATLLEPARAALMYIEVNDTGTAGFGEASDTSQAGRPRDRGDHVAFAYVLDPLGLFTFEIDAVLAETKDAGREISKQASVNMAAHSKENDYVFDHDLAVATYAAISNIDSDMAANLLTSYHNISNIERDIATGAQRAFGTIGLGPGDALPDDDMTSTKHMISSYRAANRVDNWIDTWVNFLLSRDALLYYLVILIVYVAFEGLRNLIRLSR